MLHLARRRSVSEPGTLRVLMYHRVSPSPARLAVTEGSFAAQQQFLAAHYSVVALDQVLDHARTGKALPAGAVLLTFDDGYRDNLELAKPILDAYGHPATVFVPTAFIGSDEPLPHDRAHGRVPTLTWDELRDLAGSFSIGSHGVSHQVLSRLPLDAAREELQSSRDILERELGSPITAFSYPKGSIGDFSSATQQLATAAGYELDLYNASRNQPADVQSLAHSKTQRRGLRTRLLCGAPRRHGRPAGVEGHATWVPGKARRRPHRELTGD